MMDSATSEGTPCGKPSSRATWAGLSDGRSQVDLAQLPDAALGQLRHPREWLALASALVGLVVAVGAFLAIDSHAAELGLASFGTVWVVDALLTLMVLWRQIDGAVEITPTQFADLYPVVEELRRRFALPVVRVFVSVENDVAIGAYGLWPPYSIRLSSLTVAVMDQDEFRYLLGREMGAIRFGHPRLAFLFGQGKPVLTHPVQWLLFPRQLAFSGWFRTQVLSRDRAGLLASRSVRVAVTALIKENVRPLGARVPVEALAAQVCEAMHGRPQVVGLAASLGTHQQPLMHRLSLLVQWAGPPEPAPPEATA